MDFLRYLSAVLRQWVAIVTGGVVSVIALILGTFAEFQLTPYVVLGVFVVGLFAAFYLAWRDEYRNGLALGEQKTAREVENRVLQAKVDLLQTEGMPDFRLAINELTTAEIGQGGQIAPAVFLVVTLTNQGAASVVKGWGLTLTMPNGRILSGVPSLLDKPSVTGVHPDGREETIHSSDWLPFKTTEDSVQRGRSAQGRLMYIFGDLALADLNTKGAVYELTAVDAWDRPYRTSLVQDPSVPFTPPEYFGMQPRFYSPPTKGGSVQGRSKRNRKAKGRRSR